MSDLRLDGGTQFRVQLAWAREIAEQLKKDEQARAVNPDAKPMVPAVDVFYDNVGTIGWACAFHRVEAHASFGPTEIACVLHVGSLADAIRFAARSNARHGLKLTEADKEMKVRHFLDHPEDLDEPRSTIMLWSAPRSSRGPLSDR